MSAAGPRPGIGGVSALPRHVRLLLARMALALALLVLWEAVHRAIGTAYVASPMEVGRRLAQLVASGALWTHLAATLMAAIGGFAIGWALGFAMPVALSFMPRAGRALEPYVMLAMGIPLFALIPLLILWFGIGLMPKVVIVVSMVFFIIYITTFAGLRGVDRRWLDMARVMGASGWQLVRLISRHAMVPHLLGGLKVAVPRAISAAIVSEFLVADRGLGFYIENARQSADPIGVFTGIVLVMALVATADILLNALQRRTLRWQQGATLL